MSTQVDERAPQLPVIAPDLDVGGPGRDAERDAGRVGGGLHVVDRFGNEQGDGERLAGGRLLRFDLREVEQIVDDLREPVGFADDALRELLQHADVVGRGHRLREEAERADRGLQLVADVRDEVAAHALDASRLGDVAGERHCADHLTRGVQRERGEVQHLARRPVELELALRRPGRREPGAGAPPSASSAMHVAVARAAEVLRGRVADDLAADPVDDDDAVDRLIERADQPVLRRFGLGHPIIRILFRLFDCRRRAQCLREHGARAARVCSS